MGLYGSLTEYLSAKARTLNAKPSTKVDSGGTQNTYTFDGQEISPDELREIKEIRESGGAISQLMRYKALIMFGTGAEFESDNDAIAEFLDDVFNDLDNLLIDLGEDALWYPYSTAELVETRGGDFSHVEGIEPWTMFPVTDEYGDIMAWEQQIQGTRETDTFQPEEIASFVLNKSSARDKTGISTIMRAEDEVMAYKENQRAIQQAVEQAAFRRHWWKIGREGAGVIDDNELRRVRNRLSNLEGDTQIFTGQDVDHELMDAMDPSAFKSISEMDMRNLCLALGVPIEIGSVISEGLGSGQQSGVRMQAFLLEAQAMQRALADEFIQEVVRPVLEQYSPFSADENVELVFGEPLEDDISEAEYIQSNSEYFKTDEIRAQVDKAPLDDEEQGQSFDPPGEEQDQEEMGGGGGFFSEREVSKELQVPDNAVSIDDRSEAPDGAQVVTGDRGGLYYIPASDESDDTTGGKTPQVTPPENAVQRAEEVLGSIDLGDVEESEFGDPILSAEAKEQLRGGLTDEFGEEPVKKVYDNIGAWKNESYSDSGQRLEKAFAYATGETENIRNGELEGGEPTPEEVAVAGSLKLASEQFVKENFGDQIGLKRGLSEFGTGQLMAEWLNNPDAQEIDFNLSAMSNFTIYDAPAEDFGRGRGVFETEVSADDVMLASDFIHGPQGVDEGEISIEGNERSVELEDMDVYGDLLPLTPSDLSGQQAERFEQTLQDQGQTLINSLNDDGRENLKQVIDATNISPPDNVDL